MRKDVNTQYFLSSSQPFLIYTPVWLVVRQNCKFGIMIGQITCQSYSLRRVNYLSTISDWCADMLYTKNGLTRVWRQTLALVGRNVVWFEVGVDGIVFEGSHHLLDGIRDEDEGDEAREAFLGEARHVLYDVAGIRCDQEKALYAGVHSDPQSKLHVINPIISEENKV